MIQVFKITKGIDNLEYDKFFVRNVRNTRGNSQTLCKKRCKHIVRESVFSKRVENDWNSLKESTVSAKTINEFKGALEKEWLNHPIKTDISYVERRSDMLLKEMGFKSRGQHT